MDYRQILKNELNMRCQRNPAYSLRAFAKALDLKAPHLSGIFHGKKGLSKASATKIGEALNWNESERQIFCDLVVVQHSRKTSEKEESSSRLKDATQKKSFKNLDMDEFRLLAEWHHFAILHLLEVSDFQSSSHWVARKLSLPKSEVELALERLENLQMIDRSEKPWKVLKGFIATPDVPSAAIRHFHHQMMGKAGRALDSQKNEERDFSSLILSIDDSQLPEAKRWMKEFRRKFCADLDKSATKNQIYCLSMQFFKLSNSEVITHE